MSHRKPKIAVEISGHLRTFETCAPLLRRHLLDRYDCDVFIHTWTKTEHQQLSWHGRTGMDGGNDCRLVDKSIKKQLAQFYNPTAIIYDQEVKMKKIEGFLVPPRQDPKGNRKKDFGGFSLQAVWNTLYTETQAHQLMRRHAKQQGIKYDYVIRTRPDIALQEPFLLDRYLPFFAMGTNDTGVFFPLEYVAHGAVNNASKEFIILHPRAFDVFYITTPQAMDKMMTILDHFDLFFRQLPNQFPTMPSSISNIWNIEVLFLWHIQREGILPHFAKLEYLIKRKKSIYDGRTVFPKSTGGHQAVLPPSPLVGWPRRILLTIYWRFVFLHKPWRLLKRIVKRGD